jgi:hypothetical protein
MLPTWDLDAERDASRFHAGYSGRLLEKALEEVAFVLLCDLHDRLQSAKVRFTCKFVRISLSPHSNIFIDNDFKLLCAEVIAFQDLDRSIGTGLNSIEMV